MVWSTCDLVCGDQVSPENKGRADEDVQASILGLELRVGDENDADEHL